MIRKDNNMTLKRVIFCHCDRFILSNLQYIQKFLHYVNNEDPNALNLKIKMGFIVSDGNRVYGHSAKGTPCAAVFKI